MKREEVTLPNVFKLLLWPVSLLQCWGRVGHAAGIGREKGKVGAWGWGGSTAFKPFCGCGTGFLHPTLLPPMLQAPRWWVSLQCLCRAVAEPVLISQAAELWTTISKHCLKKPRWEMGTWKHYNLLWGLLRVNEFSRLIHRTLMYVPGSQFLI